DVHRPQGDDGDRAEQRAVERHLERIHDWHERRDVARAGHGERATRLPEPARLLRRVPAGRRVALPADLWGLLDGADMPAGPGAGGPVAPPGESAEHG